MDNRYHPPKNKEGLVKVMFFSCEVKYSGSLEDYTDEDLYKMARAKFDKEVADYCDGIEWMPEERAWTLDGAFSIDHKYPCNKLVDVSWSFIDDDPIELHDGYEEPEI